MEPQRNRGIARIATKYGIIQGVLAYIIFLAQTLAGMKRNWVFTAANVALLLVLIILAHWELKKTRLGMMTYAQGLGSGTLLAGIGAVIRGLLTFVYLKYLGTGYLAVLAQTQRAALARRGITGTQAQLAMGITSSLTTPVGIAITSLITGAVMGFILALIVSIFTQSEGSMVVT